MLGQTHMDMDPCFQFSRGRGKKGELIEKKKKKNRAQQVVGNKWKQGKGGAVDSDDVS